MADGVMADLASLQLRLFTRQGCCLCEGLAEKLRALDPAPQLQLLDVDLDPALQARYGLEVPVLEVSTAPATATDPGAWRQLPRVPPRLGGTALAVWLQKNGFPGEHA